jgi:hypothetical protein
MGSEIVAKVKLSGSRRGEGSTSVEAAEKVGLSSGEVAVMLLAVVVLALWDGRPSMWAISAWGVVVLDILVRMYSVDRIALRLERVMFGQEGDSRSFLDH